MAAPSFLSNPQNGGSPDRGDLTPYSHDGEEHDGAPAGEWFGDDLPVQNGGTPFTLGGFSPNPSNPPLPRDPMDGAGRAPSGGRR